MQIKIPLGKTLTIGDDTRTAIPDAGLASDGAYFQAVNATNPIRHYRMESGTATETDYGSDGEDATNDLDASLSTDGPQKDIARFSREFSGAANEYTTAPTLTELNSSSEATFALWVKLDDLSADNALFSSGANFSSTDNILFWYNIAGGGNGDGGTDVVYTSLIGSSSVDGNRVNSQSNSALQGVWQYVVATMNGTNRKIYIDGILQTNSTLTATQTAISNQTATPRIGSTQGITGWDLDGNIADVVVWDRELSANEIANLYLAATVPNLITEPFNLASATAWESNTGIVETVNNSGAPDGSSTVSIVSATASASTASATSHFFSPSPNKIYTFSAWLKSNTSTNASIVAIIDTPFSFPALLDVDIAAGTISSSTGTNTIDTGVYDAGNGWHRFWFSFRAADSQGLTTKVAIYPNERGSVTNGDSINVWNVQITEGSGPPKPVLDPRYFPNNSS